MFLVSTSIKPGNDINQIMMHMVGEDMDAAIDAFIKAMSQLGFKRGQYGNVLCTKLY